MGGRTHRWTGRAVGRIVTAGTTSVVMAVAGVVAVDAGVAGAASLPSHCRAEGSVVTCTFSYDGTDGANGSVQKFVVPARVTALTIEAWGAQGGDVGGAVGGPGGYSDGTVTVNPGDVLNLRVGGMPTSTTGGYNGGGSAGAGGSGYAGAAGGGATDVRLRGDAMADRVVVAGGGGGSAYSSAMSSIESDYDDWTIALGGDGGAPSGASSATCSESPWQACGAGGSGSAGGTVGMSSGSPCGTSGTVGAGGQGCGGGGGGGYYGGGGGGFIDGNCCELEGILLDGPGGGGSGYVTPAATGVQTEAGIQFGNGLMRLSYVSGRRGRGPTWSEPAPIDDTGGPLSGISCPSPSFCVAVDTEGDAAVDHAGSWSTFSPVAGPGNSFTSVSCASVSFCVVVGTAPDYNGYDDDLAVIYSNGTWSSNTSASVGPGDLLTSVSCAPDTEFCVAVGWADTGPGYTAISETYQDGTWTAHDDGTGYGSSGNQLISVSCASAHFCVDGGIVQQRSDLGDYLGIDYHSVGGGGQITDEQVDGLTGEIDAVSCAGDACLAAGNSSLVFSVRRTTWSGPTAPDGASTITALSCVTSSTCVAVDDNGDALTAGAGVWSAPQSVDPGRVLTAVSCPTVTFCAAVDNAGDVVVRS